MLELNKVYCGDCLELMKEIDDKSIDMVLCDLPYGTTACKWDVIIPFDLLWKQYDRIIKDNGALVFNASQPFTSVLVMSNIKKYKHHWVWVKNRGTGFQVAKYRPMMKTEDIIVFCNKTVKYNPQMIKLETPKKYYSASGTRGTNPLAHFNKFTYEVKEKYPVNTIEISKVTKPLHPTQKPVELCEYLIKTYTNKGETVLDNCCGSGTTGVAAKNLHRNYILIEKEEKYCQIAEERLQNCGKL